MLKIFDFFSKKSGNNFSGMPVGGAALPEMSVRASARFRAADMRCRGAV